MKTMMPKGRRTGPKVAMMATLYDKHERMIRRAANHNVHVITPHGKVQVGRKGRTG